MTVSAPGSFTDPTLRPLLDLYRQLVARRYMSCSPSDIGRMLSAAPYFVARKIDGELWFLLVEETGVRLVAGNGRVATGAAAVCDAAGLPPGTVLAGELHVPGADRTHRERVGDVRTALGSAPDALAFGAFDVVRYGGHTWRETSVPERMELLRGLLPSEGPVHAVPIAAVEAEADVVRLFVEIVERQGAEGVVVRCADGRALKVKAEVTLDLAVLGYTGRETTVGPELRSLLVGVSAGPGTWVPLGTVGNMGEGIDRVSLLHALEAIEIPSTYRQAASTGQLYRMTRPEVIVECRALDLQVEDSRERPLRRPALTLVDGELNVSGQTVAASLINALALRIRDDKGDPVDGAGWGQIEAWVPVPTGAGGRLPASELLQRRVWTKETAGRTDVRKLVVWRTNKEALDPSFPAYVVHWTDYSAARKEPLAREVRPAPSLAAAEALAEAMVAENVKKGWQERA